MSIYKASPQSLRARARAADRRADRCEHYPTVAAWRREAERLRDHADALATQPQQGA